MLRICTALLFALLFCTCGLAPNPKNVGTESNGSVTVGQYFAGIELTTDGAQGVVIGLGQDEGGKLAYEVIEHLEARGAADFLLSDSLTPAAQSALLAKLDTLLMKVADVGVDIAGTYVVTSNEFERGRAGVRLRSAVELRHPQLTVEANTAELEARANFLTMVGRTDIPLERTILVDIGANNTIFSLFDTAAMAATRTVQIDYGSRNILLKVDPIYQLNARRESQRARLHSLVSDSVNLPVHRILSQAEFQSRDRFVLMGGLVYKIIKTLGVPLTGRPIDFSEASEAELPARFRALLLNGEADLASSPSYTTSELYAALVLLETITRETRGREATYFFERRTWLPGHIIAKQL